MYIKSIIITIMSKFKQTMHIIKKLHITGDMIVKNKSTLLKHTNAVKMVNHRAVFMKTNEIDRIIQKNNHLLCPTELNNIYLNQVKYINTFDLNIDKLQEILDTKPQNQQLYWWCGKDFLKY